MTHMLAPAPTTQQPTDRMSHETDSDVARRASAQNSVSILEMDIER